MGTLTLTELQNSLQMSREDTIILRSQLIPKSCGLHFERSPIKLIRAQGAYLYSDTGDEYLDCVNCVAHVGHCHANVVNAGKVAMLQMGTINLGMSDLGLEYVAKLKATLPSELDTFLFVTSGAEANDLAIQLARHYTGAFDVVTVEGAFHGSLTCTNDVSPRQFRPSGQLPEWVHVVPCPDLYRGKHRETDPKAVDKYCTEVCQVMQKAVSKDRKLACFLSEPIMTVPGVIIPPSEWMRSAYKEIRAQGGLAIADEAQSGLGRCGTSWWSFQIHENLVPDILTIGKPLGNGFPTAVVVTRRAIAEKLGLERLQSFECDNVSAAVGLAVINTVRSESLMNNAINVGTFLREGLRSLAPDHPNIGNVRGRGLMIGVEIVFNRESRKPAKNIAESICYRMKEEFIIIANDGTYKNVLCISPPMCFTMENAHRVIRTLDKILKEIESQNYESDSRSDNSYSMSGNPSPQRLISLGMLDSDEEKDDDDDYSMSGNSSTPNIFDALD